MRGPYLLLALLEPFQQPSYILTTAKVLWCSVFETVVKKHNSTLRIAERMTGNNFNKLKEHSEYECIDTMINTHDLSHLWNLVLREVDGGY